MATNSDARKRAEEREAEFLAADAEWRERAETNLEFGRRIAAAVSMEEGLPDEVRVTSETGGQKGQKACEMGRLPSSILEVAKHFSAGAGKYPDVAPGVSNWSQGYAWSLSFNALCRHLFAWWYGEDTDPELGNSHLAAVAFHALVLMDFQSKGRGTDDRVTT